MSLDDPGIMAVGQTIDRGGRGLWYRYAVQRAAWPIYNWIDDYVVELRPLPDRVPARRVFGGEP